MHELIFIFGRPYFNSYIVKLIQLQIEEKSDLLNALSNLNDKPPLQYESSDSTECVDLLRYKSFELLGHVSEIKMGLEIIKERAKGHVDKKILEQFTRIDTEISKMTDKLLESRPSD